MENNLPQKIIVDTNIMYRLYGSSFEENSCNCYCRQARKFLQLVNEGKFEICVTPTIFKEFLTSRGKTPEKNDRFIKFCSDYVTILITKGEKTKIIAQLVNKMATENILHCNSKNILVNQPLTKYSNKGERNYADTKIMAEAALFGYPILTDNLNDFEAYKNIKLLTKNYNLPTQTGKIISFKEFMKPYKKKTLVYESKTSSNNYTKLNFDYSM